MAVFMIVPSVALGDMRQFLPRVAEYEGELEVDAVYERNKDRIGETGLKTSSLSLIEKVTLSAEGYVYHPRFIIFLAKAAGSLRHEKFEDALGESPLSTTIADEYEFRVMILPRHPYNLELFTLLQRPFIRGRLVEDLRPANYQKGAIFRYKKKPFNLSMSYVTDSTSSRLFSTDSRTFNANGGHYSKHVWTSLGYTHRDASSTGDVKSTGNRYTLGNEVDFEKVRLSSNVELNRFRQEGNLIAPLNEKSFSWTEEMHLSLPWNFESNLSYNRLTDTLSSGAPAGVTEDRSFSRTNYGGFTLSHRLYSSLFTQYSFNIISVDTSGGDTDTRLNNLVLSYRKKIPGGSVMAGFNLRGTKTSRKGAPLVINEEHSAQLLQEFSPAQRNIDENTIVVRVRDEGTGSIVTLEEGVHYITVPRGTAVGIFVADLPPDVLRVDPFFIYTFLISYSRPAEDVELEISEFGYYVELDLFDHLLNPYYRYSQTREKILSGAITGLPEDSRTHTAGILIQKAPFSLLGEYEKITSNIKPADRWKTEVSYRGSITTTTSVSARAFLSKTNYSESPFVPAAYSERIIGGDLKLLKTIPVKNLSASLTGSYSNRKGIFTSDLYSVGAALFWKVGKLDITAGATLINTRASVREERQVTTYQYYALNIKRKLF